ncbi:MAG: GDP-mannose 4,6-dehydratase [Spirosomataceae bacterium]
MKALIFGINSQDGYYLQQLCHRNNIACIGISRSQGPWIGGDVADTAFVRGIIKLHQPEYIFHFAANSTTRHTALFENHQTISTGSLNILEAVFNESPASKVFLTGSGVQFENNGQPISEKTNFEASSAYSVARIQSVYAARYYRSLGLRVYVGYLFHHESIFRKETHISKRIAEAAKRIHKGSNEILEIGDLNVKKEWGYAADIASGIFSLVRQDTIWEATIGTGRAYSIRDWVETCFGLINRNWTDFVVTKNDFRAEYPLLVSNPSTINNLGWFPTVNFEDLAKKMLHDEI